MYNKVILVGNLTRDVEIRYTPNGTAVAKVGIATNRRFKNAMGEMKDETMFIDLTFFGRTAEVANQYLRKGSKVLVEGRLILEQWVAQDGTKRSRHSVTVENMQMLDTRAQTQEQQMGDYGYGAPQPQMQQMQTNNQGMNQSYQAPQTQKPMPQEPEIPEIDINEDEIPF